jgi:hypothetical protein
MNAGFYLVLAQPAQTLSSHHTFILLEMRMTRQKYLIYCDYSSGQCLRQFKLTADVNSSAFSNIHQVTQAIILILPNIYCVYN